MAAKKKAAKAKAGKSSPSSTPPAGADLDRIIDAALEEAAAMGWRNVAMTAVAERAGLALGAVLTKVPTRAHLVAKFFDRLDERTLATVTSVDPADSVRDRLFDLVMRRFDALNTHRDGARALVAGLRFDPPSLAAVTCRADRSAAALLAAAGVSPDGLIGYARMQGFKVVMLCAVRAWMDDESADLSKTMAALDRALGRAEQFARFKGFRRPQAEAA